MSMNIFLYMTVMQIMSMQATPTEARLSGVVPNTKKRTKKAGVNYTGILVQRNYTPVLRILDSVWIDYFIYHPPSL